MCLFVPCIPCVETVRHASTLYCTHYSVFVGGQLCTFKYRPPTLPCGPPPPHFSRTLICKVEEIHTTLRKHLAKEEEQLLPLLVQHFTPQVRSQGEGVVSLIELQHIVTRLWN